MDWASTRTLVTGASFIGSPLVEALLCRGASVRVVDVAARFETALTER